MRRMRYAVAFRTNVPLTFDLTVALAVSPIRTYLFPSIAAADRFKALLATNHRRRLHMLRLDAMRWARRRS